jgi:hypothetical protein
MKFSRKTQHELGYYVYGLVDPRDNTVFYVGKASGNNRAFDHFKVLKHESKKSQKIAEIQADGMEPRVDILRYGLSSEEIAFEVEAAIIDSIGIENLTNAVRGHGIERGRITAETVEKLYSSAPIQVSDIEECCIAFFIHRTYSPTATEQEIYDCTRQFWEGVSAKKRQDLTHKIALAVVDSIVIRVYSIEAWFTAGATFSGRKRQGLPNNRWEFVGQLIDDHPLVGKKLVEDDGSPLIAVQGGYTYFPR